MTLSLRGYAEPDNGPYAVHSSVDKITKGRKHANFQDVYRLNKRPSFILMWTGNDNSQCQSLLVPI